MRHRIFSFILFCLSALFLSSYTSAQAEETNVPTAVIALLEQSKTHFEKNEYEQAAALLERALRIAPSNAVLWHNLAGVRLRQKDWDKAASLAAKSNTFAVSNQKLQLRNFIVIGLACKGMQDKSCTQEAHNRASKLVEQ